MATRNQDSYKVTLHWKGSLGTQEGIGWGSSRQEAAADAMNSMGIGYGALAALDYWDAVKEAPAKKATS